ncbi:MAG TPA: VWA domain-containing protein [Pyrinomonadaceae bacterium]|nr:VWA domain-containing protein [Pyrinomonadaceae bacterium]
MTHKSLAGIVFTIFSLLVLMSPALLNGQSGRIKERQSGTRPAPSPQTSASPVPDNDEIVPDSGSRGSETVEGDVIRVDTSLVTVPVSVMDRSGKFIPDLSRQDFRIFDNGLEQKIAYFATVDQPFIVALVLDTSRSTNFKLEDIQNAAISFVNQLSAQDQVIVISFDEQINILSEPTSNRSDLVRAIRRARTGGGTRLYDAVDVVIKKKLKTIAGRKAVVLFTDGVDTTSRHASYSSTIRDAQEADSLIYPIAYNTARGGGYGQQLPPGGGPIIFGIPLPRVPAGGGIPGGGGTTPAEIRRGDEYLRELASVSGGRLYRGDTIVGLSSSFSQVADELRRQYSIGYYPSPPGQSGERRQIKVTTKQTGLAVRARDSYIYNKDKTND